jgi:hypothetical protein
MTLKKNSEKKSKRYQKMLNFRLISNPLKKLKQMHKKSNWQKKFDEH